MSENDFRKNDEKIRKLAQEYQKSKIIELKGVNLLKDSRIGESVSTYMNSRNRYDYYYNLQMRVDYILERLEWEYRDFLKREFFNCLNKSQWWMNYYSRSTYYRKKSKAMNMFLRLMYA